jgi:diacylglycerol kinase family enzyme
VRVALLFNENAGDGVSLRQICESLERHRHQVARVEQGDGCSRLLAEPCDLVVAAGGDGTVAAAARALAGRDIPLAILPLGTANNVARSLGSCGPIDELIGGWTSARRRPLDLGMVSGARGERRFVEAVGGGLIPIGIAATKALTADTGRSQTWKPVDALRQYRETLLHLKPSRWTVSLDGVRTTGSFLLVEVLNTPSIGPNLVLSPDVNPSDGFFRVVIAMEEHREQLDGHLQHLIEGRSSELSLDSQPARHVEIEGWHEMHVDDRVSLPEKAVVSVRIQPAAVQVLV